MSADRIRENLEKIEERMAAAAGRAGRRAEEVTLIAVSKTQSAEAIGEAYRAGARHFGENRVQEREAKSAALEGLGATWHLIGHLQSNKAARAAKLFAAVDSVDDPALAERLARAMEAAGPGKLRVLIEVHIAGEATKSGVSIEELPRLAERILSLGHLNLCGLMCIPPFLENPNEVRPYFRKLRELRDGLRSATGAQLPVLSMGMSHDFEVAIEEGATEVRVGTALFGARAKPQ